jgi:hypothetical protein
MTWHEYFTRKHTYFRRIENKMFIWSIILFVTKKVGRHWWACWPFWWQTYIGESWQTYIGDCLILSVAVIALSPLQHHLGQDRPPDTCVPAKALNHSTYTTAFKMGGGRAQVNKPHKTWFTSKASRHQRRNYFKILGVVIYNIIKIRT